MVKRVPRIFAVLCALAVTFAGLKVKADLLSAAALAKLVGIEMGSYAHLGELLRQTTGMVAQAKEQTTLLKVAYHGINDVRALRWDSLQNEVQRGLGQSFPELDEMFDDIRDIQDLRYVNLRAKRTLRNMLYAEVYGPAIDYLHQQHENLEAVATSGEAVKRHGGLRRGVALAVRQLAQDCEKGEGACLAAANRASIHQAAILGDLHEVLVHNLDLQQRLLIGQDHAVTQAYDQHVRFTKDFVTHAQALLGRPPRRDCQMGHCLDTAFAGRAEATHAQSRRRHLESTSPLHRSARK